MYSEIMITRSVERNIFIVDITMDKLKEGDYRDNIAIFGEEQIELGGEIKNESDEVLAIIPSRRIRISQLPETPVRQRFPQTTFGDLARDIALAWYEQSKKRISDYIAYKITMFDDFSTETTIHI